MKAPAVPEDANLGFQIAPMIDIVFVIMLFFMVMAGAMKVEREIGTRMPGGPTHVANADYELLIRIDEDGIVFLNDEEMAAGNTNFSTFGGLLAEIKRQAESSGSKVFVVIQADPQTRYQRIVDVLNSLAKARINDVSFAVGDDET